MTPTNRFTPDPTDVGREIIEAATGFRIQAYAIGGEICVRYRVEGKIDFEADPHAAGKTARLVRTMLSALEGNAAREKAKEEGESFGDGCDC